MRSERPVAVIAAGSVGSVCCAHEDDDKHGDEFDAAVDTAAVIAHGVSEVGVTLDYSVLGFVYDVRESGHGLLVVLLCKLLGSRLGRLVSVLIVGHLLTDTDLTVGLMARDGPKDILK